MKSPRQCLDGLQNEYRSLPIPTVPKAVLTLVILLQLTAVTFNIDVFPFLSVSMHSKPRTNMTADGHWRLRSLGVFSENRSDVRLLSINREATPWQLYNLDLDWREARVWHHGRIRSGSVRREFNKLLHDKGLDPVALSVELSMDDGRILAADPL